MSPAPARLPIEGESPSLAGATAWFNSPPLTAEGLRGRVVLVDVWTYTCINWFRTLPYVRASAARYKEKGLVVIGVHSPEFPFEKDLGNVRRSAKAMNVDYPIAVDSDHAIWRAFNNEYWPALYLIDEKGKIRYHQFGEGEYERMERVIQQLLAEAGSGGFDGGGRRPAERPSTFEFSSTASRRATLTGQRRCRRQRNGRRTAPLSTDPAARGYR